MGLPIESLVTTDFSIDTLLEAAVARGASDLHLTVGNAPGRPYSRRACTARGISGDEPDGIRELIYRILTTEQQKRLELDRQLDFSHSVSDLARFRVNAYLQRDTFAAAFRVVPNELRTLEELGLPASLRLFAEYPARSRARDGPDRLGQVDDSRGRDRRDQPHTQRSHHHDRGSDRVPAPAQALIVNQREVGSDAKGFADALRAALRQDPT